jgi:hypothetical protein
VKNRPESKAAGGVLTAKQAPHQPGTAPALGLRAGRDVIPIPPQTKGDFSMRFRKQSLLGVEYLEDRCLLSGDVVLEWNQLALDAIRQTNANLLLASRALAITEAAVYDSVNAIDRSFTPYFAHVHASRGASLEAAAAQAAHDSLVALFPSQASIFDAALAADLAGIPPGRARQGTEVGHAVAQQILTWRSTDGSGAVVPYTPGTDPGDSAINPAAASDPTWTPLIVTPNFPSYTSAHSTVSGAAAAVLTSLFGHHYSFTTGSDGLPGVTRSFGGFDAAAAEPDLRRDPLSVRQRGRARVGPCPGSVCGPALPASRRGEG